MSDMQRVFVALVFIAVIAVNGVSAPGLNRKLARERISELGSAQILSSAIEIREITPESADHAVVETTITLAFQFKKTAEGGWAVDAIRFGDRDWMDMSELLRAIYHGNVPAATASPSISAAKPFTPEETLHVNQSNFDKERTRMIELGASPLIPGAIEIRRVISQNEVRTIAEATVTIDFRFAWSAARNQWTIQAARLGDREWVDTVDLLTTLNEGRRRETVDRLEKLSAAIEKYRRDKGSLPAARNIVELTDILHPHYINNLYRVDGWGRPIDYAASPTTYRLRSSGPDGRPFTADDIVVNPPGTPSSP